MNIFLKLKATLRFRHAKNMADKAHAQSGNRFYVIPMAGEKKNLVIVNRYNFRKLKLKHYLPQTVNVKNLEAACFYATPYANGDKAMPKKIAEDKYLRYLKWFAAR